MAVRLLDTGPITLPANQRRLLSSILLFYAITVFSGVTLIGLPESTMLMVARYVHVSANIALFGSMTMYLTTHVRYLRRTGRVGPFYRGVRRSGVVTVSVYILAVLTGILGRYLLDAKVGIPDGGLHIALGLYVAVLGVRHATSARTRRGD